jgi:hypothetical protein
VPEILRSEDAIDVMASVLLTTAKIQIQAGKFGFERITIGTTRGNKFAKKGRILETANKIAIMDYSKHRIFTS